MLQVVLIIAAIWLAITVIGFVVKGLFWLAIIGLAAFAVTAAVGAVKRKQIGR